MGGLVAKITRKLSSSGSSSKPTKILILGLDGAGKTAITCKLKLNEYVNTLPTVGFNVESITYKNLKMLIWDIGGQKKLRELWKLYYSNADALIFVVDSGDKERFEIARQELHAIVADENMMDVPVLIFANKQDIAQVMSEELVEKFKLDSWKREWRVQRTSAANGSGLYEGLEWLSQKLSSKKGKGGTPPV